MVEIHDPRHMSYKTQSERAPGTRIPDVPGGVASVELVQEAGRGRHKVEFLAGKLHEDDRQDQLPCLACVEMLHVQGRKLGLAMRRE